MDEVVTNSDILLPTNDVGEINNSEPVDEMNKDKDYEQIDEVDDEATMEEEEALPELEDPLREIRSLEEESNMPIHELMSMYGYSNNTHPETSTKKKRKRKRKLCRKKSKDKIVKKKNSTSYDGSKVKRAKLTEKKNVS